MNPAEQDHLTADQGCAQQARAADEQPRAAFAEATAWITLALTDVGDEQ